MAGVGGLQSLDWCSGFVRPLQTVNGWSRGRLLFYSSVFVVVVGVWVRKRCHGINGLRLASAGHQALADVKKSLGLGGCFMRSDMR